MFNVNGEQPQVVPEDLAKKFIDRLTRSTTDSDRTVPVGGKVTTEASRGKKRTRHGDPVYAAALDSDKQEVQKDVRQAMTKIKKTLVALRREKDPNSRKLTQNLKKHGRNRPAYAPLWFLNGQMDKLIDDWNESWSIEATAGLLLDIGLNIKSLRGGRQDQQGRRKELMPQILADTRDVKTRRIEQNSQWVKENFLPGNALTQAGASATTAFLLLMLEEMNVPLPQVEAILNGVIGFWNDYWSFKRMTGNYHTAAEVWAVYNAHLETRLADQWKTIKEEQEQQRKLKNEATPEEAKDQGALNVASDGGDIDSSLDIS